MTLAINNIRPSTLASESWKSTERLREKFKTYEYQNVALTVRQRRKKAEMMLKGLAR